MSTCVVVVNGQSTNVDMTGVVTAEQANQLLTDAGLLGYVRVLTPEEVAAAAREREVGLVETRRQEEEARRWREALAAKLRFSDERRSVELTRKEAEVLLMGLEADYSDE